MNMKLIYKMNLLIVISILFCIGCQKEVIHVLDEDPFSRHQGTIDGGGGNGLNGKPLESFRINPQVIVDANSDLKRIMGNIQKFFPPLAARMLHIQRERAWYMVPVAL